MSDQVGCVVIGAGVVGLAVARALALQGREVMVLEQADGIGTGSSSRNSEVIHAGIYYPQGSLKAKLCVAGKKSLYQYCTERNIPHRRCGKLIVATSAEQVAQLGGIYQKAQLNGVDDISYLSRAEAQALEPELQCEAALHSPSTGILDSHAFMLALQGDLEAAGGMVVCHTQVEGAVYRAGHWIVSTADGTQLKTSLLINAAGYWAPKLALRFEGLDPAVVPQAYYAKGNYFVLNGKAPFSRLIYPVPEAAGLGVHLTLDLGGQAKFGPDVEWTDDPERLLVNPLRGDAFYDQVRRYWANLKQGDLIAGYAGIRPKISGPSEVSADFLIQGPLEHRARGLINLFGIESPGLTSSLALGDHVATIASDL